MPTTRTRTRAAVAAAASGVLSLTLVACGGSSGSSAPASSSQVETTSAAPTSSTPPATSSQVETTSADPSPAAAAGHDCSDPEGAWCDDFEDESSGWDTGSGTLVAGYSGGFYTLASAQTGILRATAPVDTTTFAPANRLQLDVKATIAGDATPTAKVGFTCWERPTQDGNGTAGFVIDVSPSAVRIGIWSEYDGQYHNIATKGRVQRSSSMELTAQCVQTGNSAFIGLRVDGEVAITTTYARSTSNFAWEPSGKVGLLVGGGGNGNTVSVAYDDFQISRVRQ